MLQCDWQQRMEGVIVTEVDGLRELPITRMQAALRRILVSCILCLKNSSELGADCQIGRMQVGTRLMVLSSVPSPANNKLLL